MLYLIYWKNYLMGSIRAKTAQDAIAAWGIPDADSPADYAAMIDWEAA